MLKEALLAGTWASVGSIFGKLLATQMAHGHSYIIPGVLLILMVAANTWGSRHYVRSLDIASNTLGPTVISATSSYILSGFVGVALFEENATWRLWLGSLLIVLGLTLVIRPRRDVRRLNE